MLEDIVKNMSENLKKVLGSGAFRYEYQNFVFVFFGEIRHDNDMLNVKCCSFEYVDGRRLRCSAALSVLSGNVVIIFL